MEHSIELCTNKLRSQKVMRQQIDKHHRQIYHAVINRQPQWAQKAAAAHVRYVCEQLRILNQQENPVSIPSES